MFSGIVAYGGVVEHATTHSQGGMQLSIRCENAAGEEVEPKDSVAINGVCLTVTDVEHNVLRFDVVPETLARSSLGSLQIGERVNVEYALRVGDRVGGHFVYGHIDASAEVLSVGGEGQGARMRIELPQSLHRLVREKGFVAVDGVSVTVADADDDWFEVALIPETMQRTTLGRRAPGDRVNLEADPIARYAVTQP